MIGAGINLKIWHFKACLRADGIVEWIRATLQVSSTTYIHLPWQSMFYNAPLQHSCACHQTCVVSPHLQRLLSSAEVSRGVDRWLTNKRGGD
jgi:hypothetical protein